MKIPYDWFEIIISYLRDINDWFKVLKMSKTCYRCAHRTFKWNKSLILFECSNKNSLNGIKHYYQYFDNVKWLEYNILMGIKFNSPLLIYYIYHLKFNKYLTSVLYNVHKKMNSYVIKHDYVDIFKKYVLPEFFTRLNYDERLFCKIIKYNAIKCLKMLDEKTIFHFFIMNKIPQPLLKEIMPTMSENFRIKILISCIVQNLEEMVDFILVGLDRISSKNLIKILESSFVMNNKYLKKIIIKVSRIDDLIELSFSHKNKDFLKAIAELHPRKVFDLCLNEYEHFMEVVDHILLKGYDIGTLNKLKGYIMLLKSYLNYAFIIVFTMMIILITIETLFIIRHRVKKFEHSFREILNKKLNLLFPFCNYDIQK